MIIGGKHFDFEHTCYVMGILNVTPDSFSDGGRWNQLDQALRHAEEMIRDGADIIDIGGESTRPGYTRISCEEEIERILPIVEGVRSHFDTVISVDTYKEPVAAAALQAGADLINDIWGLKADGKMAETIAKHGAACVLMHNRDEAVYDDFLKDVCQDLMESVEIAKDAGISEDRIILDPGVGFGKTLQHNLAAINHLDELRKLGYPVLLGTSRKSVIGRTLDLPAEERLEGTLATTVVGVERGCDIVRVHDVKENKRAIEMTKAILAG